MQYDERKAAARAHGRTQRARDKVCVCGGRGGRHTRLDCAALLDELRREEVKRGRGDG